MLESRPSDGFFVVKGESCNTNGAATVVNEAIKWTITFSKDDSSLFTLDTMPHLLRVIADLFPARA